MKTYKVGTTIIYNGYMYVEAENEKEAFEKVEENLNYETLKPFPDEVEMPNGKFVFGEATADYIDED